MGICDGRVVIVTGAGRGLGREYALAYAAEGAMVLVNDLGGGLRDGGGRDASAADSVVDEIRSLGGNAAANYDDVADWDAAGQIVKAALDAFGRLDVVVNNAGILNIVPFEEDSVENWDRTLRVHLRGNFCVTRHAMEHWSAEREAGRAGEGRIINITSGAGLQGAVGQGAYAAAKAGVAALTQTLAEVFKDRGITFNAIAPIARTRMTAEYWPELTAKPNEGFDAMDPANVAATVVWLGSQEAGHVTGCVFEVGGGMVAVEEGWHLGPLIDLARQWKPQEIGPAVDSLLARRRPPRPVWR
jgi:NAD(P)-dependent dehydrogenase (short-subunit alcohol dehydrogenase family)